VYNGTARPFTQTSTSTNVSSSAVTGSIELVHLDFRNPTLVNDDARRGERQKVGITGPRRDITE
jgi:hypothetical protein